jgi:hypothetical protein
MKVQQLEGDEPSRLTGRPMFKSTNNEQCPAVIALHASGVGTIRCRAARMLLMLSA